MTAAPTIRFRLTTPQTWALVVATLAAVAAVIMTGVRADRSRAALADYHVAYAERGGPFVEPTSLARAADVDAGLLAAAIIFALVVWFAVVCVVALKLPAFALGPDGLWWKPAFGLRWRGPVDHRDVIALQAGVRTPLGGVGMPFAGVIRRAVHRLGVDEVTLVHLRSDVGYGMARARRLAVPEPMPAEARSHLVIPAPLLATNPTFLRHLRAWILS